MDYVNMHCLVIEKASANEIMGEINKNAGGGWELFSFQVVVQGTAPDYIAVMNRGRLAHGATG
jgi:hypothetical protein